MTDPFFRMPLPDYSWEQEPTDEELGWNADIPVNIYGETEEEPE